MDSYIDFMAAHSSSYGQQFLHHNSPTMLEEGNSTNSIGWILVTRDLFRITRINQYTTTKLSRRYLVTAYKFGNGGIELSQVFSEYLAVHKAHAFKYLKGRKNERALWISSSLKSTFRAKKKSSVPTIGDDRYKDGGTCITYAYHKKEVRSTKKRNKYKLARQRI